MTDKDNTTDFEQLAEKAEYAAKHQLGLYKFKNLYHTGYSVGFSYDSSPVKNGHRSFNLTVDEINKVSASYFWQGNRQLNSSLGSTL